MENNYLGKLEQLYLTTLSTPTDFQGLSLTVIENRLLAFTALSDTESGCSCKGLDIRYHWIVQEGSKEKKY